MDQSSYFCRRLFTKPSALFRYIFKFSCPNRTCSSLFSLRLREKSRWKRSYSNDYQACIANQAKIVVFSIRLPRLSRVNADLKHALTEEKFGTPHAETLGLQNEMKLNVGSSIIVFSYHCLCLKLRVECRMKMRLDDSHEFHLPSRHDLSTCEPSPLRRLDISHIGIIFLL